MEMDFRNIKQNQIPTNSKIDIKLVLLPVHSSPLFFPPNLHISILLPNNIIPSNKMNTLPQDMIVDEICNRLTLRELINFRGATRGVNRDCAEYYNSILRTLKLTFYTMIILACQESGVIIGHRDANWFISFFPTWITGEHIEMSFADLLELLPSFLKETLGVHLIISELASVFPSSFKDEEIDTIVAENGTDDLHRVNELSSDGSGRLINVALHFKQAFLDLKFPNEDVLYFYDNGGENEQYREVFNYLNTSPTFEALPF